MPARAKLTDAQVKKIARRIRAGARQTELALEYGVNRKTIRRRLQALELAAAEQARRVEHRRQRRMRPSPTKAGNEQLSPAGAAPDSAQRDDRGHPATPSRRGHTSAGRIIARNDSYSYADWLDERDARLPALPEQRVRLVTQSGQTVGHTKASNLEHMRAALEHQHGPLTALPA